MVRGCGPGLRVCRKAHVSGAQGHYRGDVEGWGVPRPRTQRQMCRVWGRHLRLQVAGGEKVGVAVQTLPLVTDRVLSRIQG